MVISDFQLYNERIAIGPIGTSGRTILSQSTPYLDEIELLHSDRVFSIDFAALHFAAPEKNKFAYKLEGFDREWNQVQNKHQATYTNLAPGTYTFQVKAANLDGIWSSEAASLSIIVLPPFWATRVVSFCGIMHGHIGCWSALQVENERDASAQSGIGGPRGAPNG